MLPNQDTMFDTEFNISKLITAYLQGKLTDSERKRLFQWLEEQPANKSHFDRFYQEQILQQNLKTFEHANRDVIWQKTLDKMEEANLPFTRPVVKRISFRLVAAAAVLIILGISLFVLQNELKTPLPIQQVTVHDVAPGTSGATLTLANGKEISLSDQHAGTIEEESGVKISKLANGELIYELSSKADNATGENTLSTANGQTYQIRLPDGSKVWLNAASSLSYSPILIKDGKRRVKLKGEAYFEISKDKSKPFIVSTDRQEIEVLGTIFNVNAYTNEPNTRTTLLEGAIRVRTGDNEKLVKPGEQAIAEGQRIQIRPIDVENVVDWKRGDFYLNHVNFKEAMRKIARWYNVDVIYEDTVPDDMESGGWISRDRSLAQVLKSIESSGMVSFRIDGRKLYVKRPNGDN